MTASDNEAIATSDAPSVVYFFKTMYSTKERRQFCTWLEQHPAVSSDLINTVIKASQLEHGADVKNIGAELALSKFTNVFMGSVYELLDKDSSDPAGLIRKWGNAFDNDLTSIRDLAVMLGCEKKDKYWWKATRGTFDYMKSNDPAEVRSTILEINAINKCYKVKKKDLFDLSIKAESMGNNAKALVKALIKDMQGAAKPIDYGNISEKWLKDNVKTPTPVALEDIQYDNTNEKLKALEQLKVDLIERLGRIYDYNNVYSLHTKRKNHIDWAPYTTNNLLHYKNSANHTYGSSMLFSLILITRNDIMGATNVHKERIYDLFKKIDSMNDETLHELMKPMTPLSPFLSFSSISSYKGYNLQDKKKLIYSMLDAGFDNKESLNRLLNLMKALELDVDDEILYSVHPSCDSQHQMEFYDFNDLRNEYLRSPFELQFLEFVPWIRDGIRFDSYTSNTTSFYNDDQPLTIHLFNKKDWIPVIGDKKYSALKSKWDRIFERQDKTILGLTGAAASDDK